MVYVGPMATPSAGVVDAQGKSPYEELLQVAIPDWDGIFVSKLPSASWREEQQSWFTEVIGPTLGSEIATYLNTVHKAAYGALQTRPEIKEKLPSYFYSCKPLDDMLLGCFPQTLYFDIGRGGAWNTVTRSAGYLEVALKRLQNQRSTDPVLDSWISQYGLGGCVPLITRRRLVEWAVAQEARLYAVPSTSIAEAVMLTSKVFPAMREGITRIVGKSPWLDRGQTARDRGSKRLYEALKSHLLEIKGTKEGLDFFAKLTFGEVGTLEEVCQLYMQMVEERFSLQKLYSPGQRRTDEIYHALAKRFYDPSTPYSHPSYGGQADASEIVVRGNQSLTQIPWEVLLLFGDDVGTTREQLLTMAHVLHDVYPHTVIVILTDENLQPLAMTRDGELDQKNVDALSRMAITWIDGLLRDDCTRHFEEDMMLFTGDIPYLREWKQLLAYQQKG